MNTCSTSIIKIVALSVMCIELAVSLNIYRPRVSKKIPHHGFTQGLIFQDGYLYESTGLYGQSLLKKIDPKSGKVILVKKIPHIFGEGLAYANGYLFQLSWKSGKVNVYDKSFKWIREFSYSGEGWGLTYHLSNFYMTDGSANVSIRTQKDFSIRKKILVKFFGNEVTGLNELEYVDGHIYMNVWHKDYILIFNLKSKKITGLIECDELSREESIYKKEHVLNGIAYDKRSKLFYLTGKNWKWIYTVKLELLRNE